MAEITLQRLEQLRASARANRQEAIEMIHNYDGAIQTLTMLIDDLRAQEIKDASSEAMTPQEFVDMINEQSPPDGPKVELKGVTTIDNVDYSGIAIKED